MNYSHIQKLAFVLIFISLCYGAQLSAGSEDIVPDPGIMEKESKIYDRSSESEEYIQPEAKERKIGTREIGVAADLQSTDQGQTLAKGKKPKKEKRQEKRAERKEKRAERMEKRADKAKKKLTKF